MYKAGRRKSSFSFGCNFDVQYMSKEKRLSSLPSEGPSTNKKLKYETSLTEDNKTQATFRSNFKELPFSSGNNVPGECSVEPMETEITNNNLKYCEAQCSCSIHIAANENKKELEKQSNLDLKKISECACALLNDVGGVVRLQNVQFTSATAKNLDNFKGKLVAKLCDLITPLPYGEFFDLKGSFEDQDLFLFVKTFSSNGQGRISFLKTHLYLKDDHAVTRAPRKEVFDQLTEKAKGSKEIKYHLKELPIIRRDEFIYGSKLKDFQESKRIQLKAATEAGVAGIRNLKDRIKSNISAFANTEGGHIFIGVKDDLNIEGINCRGEEKEITEEITRIIREMKWGSECGSFIPEKGHHWDFEYYKVQNSPDDGAQVIVISVAGLKGIGGVHTAEPESYKYVDNLADLATSLKKLTLEDMQREVCQKQDFQAKVPSHFRNNKSSCIASVKGSCEEIKNRYFKMERGCPLVPKGFSTEGIQIIEQVQKMCTGDIGIVIGAQSWQSFLGGKTEEGVVCDFLLISRRKGLFLYTVAKKGWDVSNYNFRTATLFKRKLVAEGGMFEKFFITGHVIPLDSSRNDARVFSTPEYPDTYSATEASSRAKYSSLLKALVIVVASYPSLLANRLGLEFLNLLTKPQFKILWEHGINSNESRELWIHGGAGTGKTCVAVAFMSDLKRKLKGVGKGNILYLCENKGLRKYIEKFNVAKTVCRKTFMWSSFPNVKHVIADEAQNFRMEDGDWLAKARGLVEKSQGYLWVFLDSNQKTHEFATGLPVLKYQQPSFRLRHVIRNSVNIVKYSKQFLTYEDDGKSLEVKHNFEGEKVIRISYGNSKEACVRETLMRLAKEGYGEHDIAVLLSTQKHIDSFNVDGMSFDTEESNEGQRIVLTSIRKYSGLERPVIILVDPKAGQFQSTKGLVYLGVTRANVKLIIIERKT